MLVEVVSALSVMMKREESCCCWPCVRKVAGNKRLEVVASEIDLPRLPHFLAGTDDCTFLGNDRLRLVQDSGAASASDECISI